MKLEQLLSEQGADPLTDKLNGRPLRAFINASLKKVGVEIIDSDTPCDVILERIYGIEDPDVQSKILERAVADLKGDTNYKKFSMYGAILLTVIVVGIFFDSVMGGHLSPEAIGILKTIATGIFKVLSLSLTT